MPCSAARRRSIRSRLRSRADPRLEVARGATHSEIHRLRAPSVCLASVSRAAGTAPPFGPAIHGRTQGRCTVPLRGPVRAPLVPKPLTFPGTNHRNGIGWSRRLPDVAIYWMPPAATGLPRRHGRLCLARIADPGGHAPVRAPLAPKPTNLSFPRSRAFNRRSNHEKGAACAAPPSSRARTDQAWIGTRVISTRRFCARPASVLLSAIGRLLPAPTVMMRCCGMPFEPR